MQIQPYLNFGGRCDEALSFYQKALGAEVTARFTFGEMPPEAREGQPALPDGWDDKIMHASLRVGDGEWMASDGMPGAPAEGFAGFSLSISAGSVEEARKYVDALSDGGRVMMPVTKTFWTEGFGMVQDRFGVNWMVNVVH